MLARFSRVRLVAIAVVCNLSFWGFASPGQTQLLSEEVEIASGGPYTATSRRMQRFYCPFQLSQVDSLKPLKLTIHNGLQGSAGFTWLRVLIGSDVNSSNIGRAEEPSADLVYDENYIERHTVTVDISGKVFAGTTTLIIEGNAPKGASFGWVIEGPLSPEFASVNPSSCFPGGSLTLAGRGFSQDPGENRVTVNGRDAELLSSTRTALTIRMPRHLEPGPCQVVVRTNNMESAPYSISVAGLDSSGSNN